MPYSVSIHIISVRCGCVCKHGPAGVAVIPLSVGKNPSGEHLAIWIVQTIPAAVNRLPACKHVAITVHIVPIIVNILPSSYHVALSVEIEPAVADILPVADRIGFISIAVPPAVYIVIPEPGAGTA